MKTILLLLIPSLLFAAYNPSAPIISIPEKTDIGAMGYQSTGSAAISVEFQILLVDN